MITIIPARGGSRRIPRKNIKAFHGKPIIAYSIDLGIATSEEVYVSTDDPVIAGVAEEYGAKVIQRPSALARDEIGTQEVVGAAVRDLGYNGTVCCLYATSPLLSLGALKRGLRAHQQDPLCTCRYSADKKGQPTGGFYIAESDFFFFQLDPYTYGLPWPAFDIDINTPEDWKRAEKLYEERHANK